jgi:cytochrome c biogenesis protein CcdA
MPPSAYWVSEALLKDVLSGNHQAWEPSMELWTVLLPILAADVVNPVLFAFMVYAAGSSRPVLYSSVLLMGHTLAYFFGGIGLTLGMGKVISRLQNPGNIDFVISMILGLGLLYFALKSRNDQGKKPVDDGPSLTLVSAFSSGAIINFVGIPFALPYFAVIDQMLKADLPFRDMLMVLGGYNLIYALPFVLVPVLVATMGKSSQPILNKINGWLERVSAILMPLLLGLVGLALVIDVIVYFVSGKGLF